MTDKIQHITICMGSSCFSRGNKKIITFIQNYLKEKQLEDEVVFKGNHCMGNCQQGPMLDINGELIYRVEESKLEEILNEKLGK